MGSQLKKKEKEKIQVEYVCALQDLILFSPNYEAH